MPGARSNRSLGLGVDTTGIPAVDPTQNVKDLSIAANKRQDDIRELTTHMLTMQMSYLEKIMDLRSDHFREVRMLESDRLDKIRQVDVLAGNTAADRALVAIQTLATSQAAAAETLRAMVSSTATTIANQTAASMSAVTERIAALEKSSYEGKGKQAVSDPMMVDLMSEIKALRTQASMSTGKIEARKDYTATVFAVVGAVLGICAIAVAILR